MLVDLDRRVLVLDRLEVGVRADGGRRRDDADPPDAGGERGRGRTGPDDTEDGQVVAATERGETDGRGGVAGDDDRLDVALDERIERLRRECQDLLVAPRSVRGAAVVAEVDRRFVRGPADDLAEDRQSTHP